VICGFAVDSGNLAYNGLLGLLQRQFVCAELLIHVEVFDGASTFVNAAAPMVVELAAASIIAMARGKQAAYAINGGRRVQRPSICFRSCFAPY